MNGNTETGIKTAPSDAELSKAFQNLRFKLDLLQKLAPQSSAGLRPTPTSALRASSSQKKKSALLFSDASDNILRSVSPFCALFPGDLPKARKNSDCGAEK